MRPPGQLAIDHEGLCQVGGGEEEAGLGRIKVAMSSALPLSPCSTRMQALLFILTLGLVAAPSPQETPASLDPDVRPCEWGVEGGSEVGEASCTPTLAPGKGVSWGKAELQRPCFQIQGTWYIKAFVGSLVMTRRVAPLVFRSLGDDALQASVTHRCAPHWVWDMQGVLGSWDPHPLTLPAGPMASASN